MNLLGNAKFTIFCNYRQNKLNSTFSDGERHSPTSHSGGQCVCPASIVFAFLVNPGIPYFHSLLNDKLPPNINSFSNCPILKVNSRKTCQ